MKCGFVDGAGRRSWGGAVTGVEADLRIGAVGMWGISASPRRLRGGSVLLQSGSLPLEARLGSDRSHALQAELRAPPVEGLLAAAVRLELPLPRRGEGLPPLAGVQLLQVLRVLVGPGSSGVVTLTRGGQSRGNAPQILASRAWASRKLQRRLTGLRIGHTGKDRVLLACGASRRSPPP